MFGYVRAQKPELRIREYEQYKAVYCSLCRELGRSFGPFARFTLSYDFTFLAMLRMGFAEECPKFTKKRCAFNPLIKCNHAKSSHLEFSANAAVLLLYYKLLDDITDSRGPGSIFRKIIKPFFSRARNKALKKYPEIDELIKNSIIKQAQVEKEEFHSIDYVCEPSAQMLSGLFEIAGSGEDSRVLARMGYCIGKWIYLADALDDLDDDRRAGGYNPIIEAENISGEDILGIMNIAAGEAAAAFELLEMKRFREIFENILYLGLPSVGKQILTKTFPGKSVTSRPKRKERQIL